MTQPADVQDLDLRRLFAALRRYALPIVLFAALAAALAYVVANSQARVYEAVASVAALRNDTGNNVIGSTLLAAPPLPPSVVERAVHGRTIVTDIIERLEASDLPSNVVAKIARDMRQELASNSFSRVQITASVDNQSQTGLYELRARAESPQAAQLLANSTMRALLQWDQQRAAEGVRRARDILQEELRALDARIARAPDEQTRRALLTTRGTLLENLQQVAVLDKAVTGTLTLVTEADAPLAPVQPRPVRNAILVLFGMLFFGAVTAVLVDALRRRVSTPDDLRSFGVSVLGTLPNLGRVSNGWVEQARSGPLYESVGFLRVNVLASLEGQRGAVLAISSPRPSEGKSSVTAALAVSFATSGLRVLVVDADVYRPTQNGLWMDVGNRGRAAVTLGNWQFWSGVSERVDLVVPSTRTLDAAPLAARVRALAQDYDIILVDTPPMMAVAETLSLAARLDGLLMVVEAGQTDAKLFESALTNARQAGVNVFGVVLNRTKDGLQSYAYGYRGAVGQTS